MKRILLSLLLIGILLLSACGTSDTGQSPPSAQPSGIENSQPSLTTAEEDYRFQVAGISFTTGDAFSESSRLLADPYIGDEDWEWALVTQMATIQLAYQRTIALTPPASMQYIHTRFLSAMTHYNNAMDFLAQGLDELDESLLDQAMLEMDMGIELMNEATSLIEDFLSAHGM